MNPFIKKFNDGNSSAGILTKHKRMAAQTLINRSGGKRGSGYGMGMGDRGYKLS